MNNWHFIWILREHMWQRAISGPALVYKISLQWRHNEHNGFSNHQPHDCLFKRRSKKTSRFRVTGLCEGNSPETGEFPTQRASNAENVSFDDVIMLSIFRLTTGTYMAGCVSHQKWWMMHQRPLGISSSSLNTCNNAFNDNKCVSLSVPVRLIRRSQWCRAGSILVLTKVLMCHLCSYYETYLIVWVSHVGLRAFKAATCYSQLEHNNGQKIAYFKATSTNIDHLGLRFSVQFTTKPMHWCNFVRLDLLAGANWYNYLLTNWDLGAVSI